MKGLRTGPNGPRRSPVRHDRVTALLCGQDRLGVATVQAARGRPRLESLELVPLTADLLAAHGSPLGCCRALLPDLVARHDLRGRRAVVVLESARTAARFWAAPDLPERDRLGALGFEAEKWCQTPAAGLWLGCLDAPPPVPGGPGRGVPGAAYAAEEGVLAVAAPLDGVAPLLRAVAEAGLEPWGVTVPSLALESLLVGGADDDSARTAAAVHIGAQRSWLTVCARGRLLMVRELEVARDGLAAALALIPVEGRGSVRLTVDEAAELLTRVGWVADDEPFGMASEQVPLESLKFALRPVLERLASSISRSLDFCREQYFVEIPETIALTGEGATVPHLDTYLGANLLTRFERGIAWEGRLDVGGEDAARWAAAPELACVATGAALGGLRGRVLPARAAALGLPRWFTLPVRRVLAGAAVVLALACLATEGQTLRLRARVAADGAKVAALEARLDAARRDWRVTEAGRVERQLVEIFARGNVRADGILKTLSRAVGPDVTLTELNLPSLNGGLLELGAAPATAAPAGEPPPERDLLTLSGLVRTDRERVETVLSRLIVALENGPYFQNVTFVRSEEEGAGSATFQLRCRVRQGLRPAAAERVVANR
ncbi:MAG: hypothetical protein ACYDIE_07975 [Candidatus Krumholzibacteriia bacterium]